MAAAERFGQKVMRLPPAWRKAVLDDAQGRIVEWFKPTWTGRVQRAWSEIEAGRTFAVGESSPLGFLPDAVIQAIEAHASATDHAMRPLQSVLLSISDQQIYHALRDAKGHRHDVLQGVLSLPDWLGLPDTEIYRDGAETLLFARRMPNGRYMTTVFRVDELPTRVKESVRGNRFIAMKVVGDLKYERLK